jgi:hypothetical protein
MIGKLSAVLFGVLAVVASGEQDKPEGYRQIIPRGRIAAVNQPTYVPASKAEIKPGSWVLGVIIDGQPRAYSLNLLNAHEVVNDTIGDTNYAAVW